MLLNEDRIDIIAGHTLIAEHQAEIKPGEYYYSPVPRKTFFGRIKEFAKKTCKFNLFRSKLN